MVKKLSAVQETRVRLLGQEDPLEKRIATHSSIPVWRIPCTEEPGGLQFMGSQRVGYNWTTNTFTLSLAESSKQWNSLHGIRAHLLEQVCGKSCPSTGFLYSLFMIRLLSLQYHLPAMLHLPKSSINYIGRFKLIPSYYHLKKYHGLSKLFPRHKEDFS